VWWGEQENVKMNDIQVKKGRWYHYGYQLYFILKRGGCCVDFISKIKLTIDILASNPIMRTFEVISH